MESLNAMLDSLLAVGDEVLAMLNSLDELMCLEVGNNLTAMLDNGVSVVSEVLAIMNNVASVVSESLAIVNEVSCINGQTGGTMDSAANLLDGVLDSGGNMLGCVLDAIRDVMGSTCKGVTGTGNVAQDTSVLSGVSGRGSVSGVSGSGGVNSSVRGVNSSVARC